MQNGPLRKKIFTDTLTKYFSDPKKHCDLQNPSSAFLFVGTLRSPQDQEYDPLDCHNRHVTYLLHQCWSIGRPPSLLILVGSDPGTFLVRWGLCPGHPPKQGGPGPASFLATSPTTTTTTYPPPFPTRSQKWGPGRLLARIRSTQPEADHLSLLTKNYRSIFLKCPSDLLDKEMIGNN